MEKQLYQVFDAIAECAYGPIIAAARDAAAIRIFQEAAADERTELHKYPADYILLKLGTQDDSSGTITALPAPLPIYSGIAYVEAKRLTELNASAKAAPAPANGADASTALLEGARVSTFTEDELEQEFQKRLFELRSRHTG